jgi:hypothetical protein
MDIDKVEIFINNQCQGAVRSLTVNGASRGPSYASTTWWTTSNLPPNLQPPYKPLMFKLTQLGLQGPQAQGTKFTFTLDPRNQACNTADKFFYGGDLHFAYANGGAFSNNCCGMGHVTYLS